MYKFKSLKALGMLCLYRLAQYLNHFTEGGVLLLIVLITKALAVVPSEALLLEL